MSEIRIGTCSLCGGDVRGWHGAWGSVYPPPPPKCSRCGAVPKGDVIDMVIPPRLDEPVLRRKG